MDDNPSVLFIAPPGGSSQLFEESIGIGFLISTLKRSGITASQYLPTGNPSVRTFVEDIKRISPHSIGFTVYDTNIDACRVLAKTLREACPLIPLFLGGPTVTFSPTYSLNTVPAHFGLRGAGEGYISEIIQSLPSTLSSDSYYSMLCETIPNIVSYDRCHRIVGGSERGSSFPARHFDSLDDIPSPYRDGVVREPRTGYLTSRGCNQNCTYCSFAELSTRKVKFHSVERVIDDLSILSRAFDLESDHVIPIYDDTFTLQRGRVQKICDEMIRVGLKARLSCVTRGDKVDLELLRLLKAAGFICIAFGLESASPKVLRAIGKIQPPGTEDDPTYSREIEYLSQFRMAVRWATEAGLRVQVSMMAGLPQEEVTDLHATLAYIRDLEVPHYVHNVLRVFEGTPLFREAAEHSIVVSTSKFGGQHVTTHKYDVMRVEPLPNSSVYQRKKVMAWNTINAMCGRPNPVAGAGVAWAVVVHEDCEMSEALFHWISTVMMIGGTLVKVTSSPHLEKDEELFVLLRECGVILHQFVLLQKTDQFASPNSTYRGSSTFGGTNVFSVRRLGSGPPVWRTEHDNRGDWTVEIINPHPRSVSDVSSNHEDLVSMLETGSGLTQIADCCRWINGRPRCMKLAVLHVRKGGVAACWGEDYIGQVGDSYEALQKAALEKMAKRGEEPARCPYQVTRVEKDISANILDSELVSRILW